MQVQVFNIRLSAAHMQSDQDNMNHFLKGRKFKKSSSEFVSGPENFWSVLVFYEDETAATALPAGKMVQTEMSLEAPAPKEEKAPPPPPEEMPLTPEEDALYQTLRHWRQAKAQEIDLPVFMVAHNSELMQIARIRPQSLEMLSEIKGFGPQKIQRYGDEILAVLNAV